MKDSCVQLSTHTAGTQTVSHTHIHTAHVSEPLNSFNFWSWERLLALFLESWAGWKSFQGYFVTYFVTSEQERKTSNTETPLTYYLWPVSREMIDGNQDLYLNYLKWLHCKYDFRNSLGLKMCVVHDIVVACLFSMTCAFSLCLDIKIWFSINFLSKCFC